MALIQRGMYEQFAARHLAVKGPGALTNIEEGVMGTLPLDLSSDPMYWHIQGIRTFSNFVGQAAGAGQYAKIGLSIEDAAEQVLVRILGVWITVPATTSDIWIYRCARTDFSSDPGIYGVGTDTRIPEAQPSKAIILNASDALTPGTRIGAFSKAAAAADEYLPQELPLIISPTEAIYFRLGTAAAVMYATICWVEIPAYKAEL